MNNEAKRWFLIAAALGGFGAVCAVLLSELTLAAVSAAGVVALAILYFTIADNS
jgi:hypothetical protein